MDYMVFLNISVVDPLDAFGGFGPPPFRNQTVQLVDLRRWTAEQRRRNGEMSVAYHIFATARAVSE
jgi:hypothetical protein